MPVQRGGSEDADCLSGRAVLCCGMRRSRVIIRLTALCLVGGMVLAAAVTPRLCAGPIDLGSAARQLAEETDEAAARAPVAAWLRQLSRRHVIRFPAHVALGA